MTGEILTPTSIWSKFNIENIPTAEVIGEYREGEVSLSRIRIEGEVREDGVVKIYAVFARNVKKKKSPAIFILQKFTDGADETLAMAYARMGYSAFVVNVGGDDGYNNNFTIYPPSLAFANYKNAKDNLDRVNGPIKESCWYQWGVTARYAYAYLKSLPSITKIAGLGIGDSATVLWHMSVTEKFDCLAFVLNAGWRAYLGNFKFSGNVDEQFTDDKIKYLAGIEPQSYANHVSVPTIMVTATNSSEFDFERSHDTIARIKNVYTAIHYTVGGTDSVDYSAFNHINGFFNEFLVKKHTQDNLRLPHDPSIRCEIADKKIKVYVKPFESNVKDVVVYAAEEILNPAFRQWQKITEYTEGDDEMVFEYSPYDKSGIVFFFAEVIYKNGFSINSDIISKRFKSEEVLPTHKSKILYSSREENSDSAFYSAGVRNKKPSCIAITEQPQVEEKKGAMDILGITCESGLLSFRIGAKKYAPTQDGILIFDAYLKKDGTVTVKLITTRYGERVEYKAKTKVEGGEVWHNLKFSLSNFKSNEGMAIRSVESIQAMEINADTEYLINNVLWV